MSRLIKAQAAQAYINLSQPMQNLAANPVRGELVET
jgi:hypothetical protein